MDYMDVISLISSSFECFNNDGDVKDEKHNILLNQIVICDSTYTSISYETNALIKSQTGIKTKVYIEEVPMLSAEESKEVPKS